MISTSNVLIAPVVTEKTVAQTGKYTFQVHTGASKDSVAKAVKSFYGVDVTNVNIVRLPAKTRVVGRGRLINKRPELKKAIVTLKTGQTLNFNDFK
ncbi:50S ribosomal protein L23 [bacterium]|nr:50S ribosomal protein L23 [bacterium]NCQ55054.1 50S ribosomal protein L23 [Candidatus Parcubacteria bacterium]NCS67098.1 50S ribosomal protein L23 [Candidatus Peregrinibacteria bacterium]NCS96044.1 50S ribosomal protein L23 [bacterium]